MAAVVSMGAGWALSGSAGISAYPGAGGNRAGKSCIFTAVALALADNGSVHQGPGTLNSVAGHTLWPNPQLPVDQVKWVSSLACI